jgi:transcriptional regulator CtsR
MKRSDRISDYILAALSAGGGIAEMQRGAIAREFGCVPSQITYVLETRFTPENGYLIETRRGGGGYIRIIRKRDDPQQQLADFLHALPAALSEPEVLRLLERLITFSLLSEREARLLAACCSDALLEPINQPYRDRHRARTFATALHRLTV